MNNTLKAVPRTVGIIMDGNGRWAQQHKRQRLEGHTKGIHNMISLVAHAFDCGVKNIICYGLSTENLNRPKQEVEHIYKLIVDIFDIFVQTFSKLQVSIKYIGNLSVLPPEVLQSMSRCETELDKYKYSGKIIYVAIAYGSRFEIIQAINNAVRRGEPVTEEQFLSMLSMPAEPELIIRTGGEQRLSNFLLYQASYSELYFSEKLFPDFSNSDLDEAFNWYAQRNRKFGLIGDIE